jgi:integrase
MGNGKWRGRINLPKKSGPRKQASIIIKAQRKGEAEKKFEEWKVNIRKSHSVYPDVLSVADLVNLHQKLCDSKLRHGKIKKSTHDWYRHMSRRVLLQFGGRIADELTEDDVQEFIDQLHGSISDKYLLEHVKYLKVIYRYAKRKKKIRLNIMEDAEDLVYPARPSYDRPKMLNYSQIGKILGEARENRALTLVIHMALHTGMRRSEILGLLWERVDFKRGIIEVRHQLKKDGTEFKLEPLKTRQSTRDIPITGELSKILQQHRDEQSLHQEQFGLDDSVFVVTDSLFKPIDPNLVSAWFRKAANDNELKGFTLHSIRHTFCSTMIYAGVDLLTLSKIMGHYSPEFTLKVYGHIFDDQRKKAMGQFERKLNEERNNMPKTEDP